MVYFYQGWFKKPIRVIYAMLNERVEVWGTFTVFDFGQILTFLEMSLNLLPLAQDCLFMSFKHP